jgi:hypothetical protein
MSRRSLPNTDLPSPLRGRAGGGVNHLRRASTCLIATIASLFSPPLAPADPCASGPRPGAKAGPYSFNVATGPERGQQTCYVCAAAEKPVVVVFARKLSDPLGKLLTKCDDLLLAKPKDSMRCWMTLLGEQSASLDALAKWTKDAGIKKVPVGVFDDPAGPPSYQLNADAEVTVLLWVNRRVVATYAFRAGELNDEAIKKVTEGFPKLFEKK